ncbi:hypothetical protein JK32_00163 [Shigella phage JK32]|nr:hypothetical protein JK32_00163 [Shigella phage JK32]
MSKKKDSYVQITKKQYDELMLAVAYAIMRSDLAIQQIEKTNKSLENVAAN